MVPTNNFTQGRAALIPAPPALTLKLVNIFPPHMPLALFELPPLCWGLLRSSKFVSKQICVWVPQKEGLGLKQPSISLRHNLHCF